MLAPGRLAAQWDFGLIPTFGSKQTSYQPPPFGGVTAPPLIQAKLAVGAADDPLEREADAIAEQVTRGSQIADAASGKAGDALPWKCSCGASADRSGECEECRQKCEVGLQRETFRADVAPGASSLVFDVLRSPGRPLGDATRFFMEQRFRRDFSRVRVHTDARAAESALAVSAHAYTVGDHIAFGAERYAPWTPTGTRLLAHELTHTLQQRSPGGVPLMPHGDSRDPSSDGISLGQAPRGGHPIRFRPTRVHVPVLQRAPTFLGCTLEQQASVARAIEGAKKLAEMGLLALNSLRPFDLKAKLDNFGETTGPQEEVIRKRYRHARDTLDGKTIDCKTKCKKKKASDICAQGDTPGSRIYICDEFGTPGCPEDLTILHEAVHNAGAKDPPARPEDNAYSYENFARDVREGTPKGKLAPKQKEVEIQ
jgi:hypothetical protein